MNVTRHTLAGASLALLLAACSDSNNNNKQEPETPVEPTPTYSAEVRRTQYGIPHIKANDWAGLGYGYGYAYSQDNYCVTMAEIAKATGRSAELMGAAGDVGRDLLYRYLNGSKEAFRANFFDALPPFAQELAVGYAAGMNRYLRDTGVDNLPEGEAGCRGAAWVYEVDEIDLFQYLRLIGLAGSSDQSIIRDGILRVQGPDGDHLAALDQLGVEPFPGRALASLGDLDGDGVGEIAVGVPFAPLSPGAASRRSSEQTTARPCRPSMITTSQGTP